MGKYILTYGLISGVIVGLSMLLGGLAASGDGFILPVWVGYLVMLVALVFIFLGVKKYRDHEQGGVIRFGKALLVGLGIAVIASIIYVIAWEVQLAQTGYAFMNDYAEQAIAAKQASGASAAEVAAYREEMAASMERYRNLPFRLMITFSEIIPVGLVVSLVSAALLRNSKFLPARAG